MYMYTYIYRGKYLKTFCFLFFSYLEIFFIGMHEDYTDKISLPIDMIIYLIVRHVYIGMTVDLKTYRQLFYSCSKIKNKNYLTHV